MGRGIPLPKVGVRAIAYRDRHSHESGNPESPGALDARFHWNDSK